MELNIKSSPVDKSDDFEEQFFGMGDLSVVMTILRSKLYSNPIKIIVQEILSNARDAHREVGKADVPVEVSLPSFLSPNFEVKDVGPGISPDRMANVFIRYGCSTKRDDNLQTGGFGLGAKSPFAYTDSFVIETVTDKKKRVYVAYIDESSVGKISLLSCEDTEDCNGTTIKIPVQQRDFNIFKDYFYSVTQYWDVRPVVNDEIIYWNNNPSFQNKTNAFWFESDQNNIKILIDKIPYILTLEQIGSIDYSRFPEITQEEVNLLFSFGFCLEVPCGKITVSANREQIEINDNNLHTLFTIFKQSCKEMYTKFQNDIDAQKTYWGAIELIQSSFKLFKHLEKTNKISWKGTPIPANLHFHLEKFNKFSIKVYEPKSYIPERIEFLNISSKMMSKNVIWLIKDTQSNGSKRIRKLIENNNNHSIFLVIPKYSEDNPSSNYFTSKVPKACIRNHFNGLLAAYGGHKEYKVVQMSELEYDKASRNNTPPIKLLKTLYLSLDLLNNSLDDILADDTVKIFCVCTKYSNIYLHNNENVFAKTEQFESDLKTLFHHILPNQTKVAVFGCSYKVYYKYATPNIDLFQFIQEKIQDSVSPFMLNMITSVVPPNFPITFDSSFQKFVEGMVKQDLVKNFSIKNMFRMLHAYFNTKNNSSIKNFILKYHKFFSIPIKNGNSFLSFVEKFILKHRLLKHFNLRFKDTPSFIQDISEYINNENN